MTAMIPTFDNMFVDIISKEYAMADEKCTKLLANSSYSTFERVNRVSVNYINNVDPAQKYRYAVQLIKIFVKELMVKFGLDVSFETQITSRLLQEYKDKYYCKVAK